MYFLVESKCGFFVFFVFLPGKRRKCYDGCYSPFYDYVSVKPKRGAFDREKDALCHAKYQYAHSHHMHGSANNWDHRPLPPPRGVSNSLPRRRKRRRKYQPSRRKSSPLLAVARGLKKNKQNGQNSPDIQPGAA